MESTPRSPMEPGRAEPLSRGFALLEVLISLTLVAVALLLVLQLLVLDARTLHRIVAQREVLEVAEGLIESLRTGNLPPATVQLNEEQVGILLQRDVRPITIDLRVSPNGEVIDLWDVWIQAEYRAGLEPQTRTLETRIWRP